MRRAQCGVFFGLSLALLAGCGGGGTKTVTETQAPTTTNAPTDTLGTSLVNRYLSALQHHDVAALRAFLSPAWQLQRADGSRETKASFLGNLSTLRSYKLRDVRTTGTANVVVVTMEAESDVVVNGKPYRMGYAPRLATFLPDGKDWQMTSFANFNTPR